MNAQEFDYQPLLTEFYSHKYLGGEKHDSPDKSRVTLIQKIAALLSEREGATAMLDVGAGRQSLERQLFSSHGKKPWIKGLQVITIDIANILAYQLLVQRDSAQHLRSNGLLLPFADNSMDLVVSNHAIDFLPHEAFSEAARVLSPSGAAAFNFHHPNMTEQTKSNPQINQFWEYLTKNNILFQNADDIVTTLADQGLTVEHVALEHDRKDQWWEVVAAKK